MKIIFRNIFISILFIVCAATLVMALTDSYRLTNESSFKILTELKSYELMSKLYGVHFMRCILTAISSLCGILYCGHLMKNKNETK